MLRDTLLSNPASWPCHLCGIRLEKVGIFSLPCAADSSLESLMKLSAVLCATSELLLLIICQPPYTFFSTHLILKFILQVANMEHHTEGKTEHGYPEPGYPEPAHIGVKQSAVDYENEDIETNTGGTRPLKRGLKSRHMQMIGIGGAIGAGLFVSSGGALSKGGPASLVCCHIFIID